MNQPDRTPNSQLVAMISPPDAHVIPVLRIETPEHQGLYLGVEARRDGTSSRVLAWNDTLGQVWIFDADRVYNRFASGLSNNLACWVSDMQPESLLRVTQLLESAAAETSIAKVYAALFDPATETAAPELRHTPNPAFLTAPLPRMLKLTTVLRLESGQYEGLYLAVRVGNGQRVLACDDTYGTWTFDTKRLATAWPELIACHLENWTDEAQEDALVGLTRILTEPSPTARAALAALYDQLLKVPEPRHESGLLEQYVDLDYGGEGVSIRAMLYKDDTDELYLGQGSDRDMAQLYYNNVRLNPAALHHKVFEELCRAIRVCTDCPNLEDYQRVHALRAGLPRYIQALKGEA